MISDFYSQTIILLDKSSSTGSYWSTSTGDEYTTGSVIKGAVNQLSADEIFRYDAIGYNAQYKLFCEPSTQVYAGRRILWNADTYEVINIPKNTLQKNHHFRTLLKKVV